jgi:hypothetical protein
VVSLDFNPKQSNDPNCSPFRSVAFFPWSLNSLDILWEGGLSAPENLEGWKEMISELSGSIAVGGDGKLFVFSLRNKRGPFCVKLPHVRHLRIPLFFVVA